MRECSRRRPTTDTTRTFSDTPSTPGTRQQMPRNLDTRVELVAPVQDPSLRDQVMDTLERSLADEANAWELRPDGTWERRDADGPQARSVQRELMAQHSV